MNNKFDQLGRRPIHVDNNVIIEQEKALVEIYKRKGDLWKITRIEGLERKMYLSSLDVEIDLVEIYRDVEIS